MITMCLGVHKVYFKRAYTRDEMAGKDWLTGFMKGHSDLSIKVTEATKAWREP